MASKPDRPKIHLYDIPLIYQELEAELDEADGELSPELEAKFNALEGTLEEKHDNIRKLIAYKYAMAESLKPEIERLSKRRQASNNAGDRLRQYLFDVMKTLGRTRIETTLFTSAEKKNGGKPKVEMEPGIDMDSFAISNPRLVELIPSTYELDRDAIIDSWKNKPDEIPPCIKVTQGTHLALR